MHRCRVLLPTVILLIAPANASAWNSTGHMTVSLLAYQKLSDAQKMKAAAILKNLPGYDKFLGESPKRPMGVSDAEWTFTLAATWPDWIKGRPGHPQPPEIATYNMTHEHYLNTPFRAPGYTGDLPTLDETNILNAFKKYSAKLKAADTSAKDQAAALAWILHLVGDVHQPLHCATYYSEQFPKGDEGGNLMQVMAGHRAVKLHAYWDDLLGTTVSYAIVDENVKSLMTDSQLNPESVLKTALGIKNFNDWADESYKLAVNMAYLNGDLKFHALNGPRDFGSTDIPALPEDYMSAAKSIARRRVALAGYRLADQVKDLLGE